MNPNTIEAGPELDALVAEKVMGADRRLHHWIEERDNEDWASVVCEYCGVEVAQTIEKAPCNPPYSNEIAAAWEVVEKLRPLMIQIETNRHGHYSVVFFDRDGGGDGFFPELKTKYQESTISDEAPLAICRAALKAVGA